MAENNSLKHAPSYQSLCDTRGRCYYGLLVIKPGNDSETSSSNSNIVTATEIPFSGVFAVSNINI